MPNAPAVVASKEHGGRQFGTLRRLAGHLLVVTGVFVLVLPPLLALIVGAFSAGRPGLRLVPSWINVERAFGNAELANSLINSLLYATVSASIVVVLGAFIAWVIERTDSRIAPFAQMFSLIPILIPAVTLVSAWIMLLSPRGGLINLTSQAWFGGGPPFDIFTFAGMIWVGVLQELPLAVLWLWPAFRAMNPEMEEAARTSGAGNVTVLLKITIPILMPALLGAWIIFFIYSLGALSVAVLIGLPSRIFVYATEIYLAVTRMPAQYGLASFYSLLFLGVTVAAIAIYYRVVGNDGRFATVRGKAYRPRRISLGPWRTPIDLTLVVLIVLIAVLPILILTWNAFMPFPQLPSRESLSRASFANFVSALNYGPAVRAIWNSLWIGVVAGVATTLLGVLIAWLRLRGRDDWRLIVVAEQAAMAPIAIPGVIVGVSLLWFWLWIPIGVYASPWILMIAYAILHLPYAIRITSSGLIQLHSELEEAGRVSGAGLLLVARLIVLPLLAPTLTAAAVYCSLRAFREYAASLFLTSPGTEVFAVVVLDMWQSGNTNILAAYTVMVMLLLAALIGLANFFGNRFGVRA